MTTIGQRLTEERKQLNMNQTQFGELGGVKTNAQGNYENDSRTPDAEYLAAIADHGVDINYIVTGIRTKNANRYPPKDYLKDFIGTYLDVQEVMKGQSNEKIFETAYAMHLKIMARIESSKATKPKSKKAVNE